VLRIVLPIVALVLLIVNVFELVIDWPPDANPFAAFGLNVAQLIGIPVGSCIQAFAIITIIFAILQRTKADLGGDDPLGTLPPVPLRNERISIAEPIFGIAFGALFVVVFLAFPGIFGGWFDDSGWVPLLNAQVLQAIWFLIVLFFLVGVVKDGIKLFEGRHGWPLAITTLICNVISVPCLLLLFAQKNLINATFIQRINDSLSTPLDPIFETQILPNLGLMFAGLIILALFIEALTACIKAVQSSERR
jgi:hypothetical protein